MTMELWKEAEKGTSGIPPKLRVTVNQWLKSTIYAFNENSGWKFVHFTWNP